MKSIVILLFGVLLVQISAADWDLTSDAIATKVLKKGNRHSYQALKTVEGMISTKSKNLALYELVKDQYAPVSSDDLIPAVSVDLPGFSIPAGDLANNLYGIGDEAKNSMYSRLTNLKEKFNDSSTPQFQKELIGIFFKDYFNVDLSQSGEDIISSGDPDFIELNQIYKANKDLKDSITEEVWKSTDVIIGETEKTVNAAMGKLNKKLDQESKEITDTINNTTAAIKSTVDQNNASLLYLTAREREREFTNQLNSVSNSDRMQEWIDIAASCEKNMSANKDCDLLIDKKEELQDRKSFLVRKDINTALMGGLNFMSGLAAVTNNPELAETVSKAVFVAESAQKITDLALGLGSKAALASMGDVMSMAGLAMNAYSALKGSSGPSSDELILEQLFKIRQQIESLRKEIHERFDRIESQVSQLGITMNLKFQNTDSALGVVVDNQQYLIDLVEKNSVAIANVIQIQSNMETGRVLSDLIKTARMIRSEEKVDILAKHFQSATTSLISIMEYTETLPLVVPMAENYEIKSPESILLVSNLSAALPQKNFSNFAMIDFLIKASLQSQLGGDCGSMNFNKLFLFNIVGSKMLPLFREEFDSPALDFPESNKYLNYLKTGNFSEQGTIDILNRPIEVIDQVITAADRCLQNYAKIDNKPMNIFAYLVDEYRKLVMSETQRILDTTTDGAHLQALQRAVRDGNEHYFSDMEKEVQALDPQSAALRKSIDITKIDFKKTLSENTGAIDDLFYEKMKKVRPCTGYEKAKPIEPAHATQDNGIYEEHEIPKSLLLSVFPKIETRLSVVIGLNPELNICYRPASLVYEETDPVIQGIKTAQAFTLIVSQKVISVYESYLSSIHVPIYVPIENLEFYSNYRYTVTEPVDDPEHINPMPDEIVSEHYVISHIVKASSLNKLFNDALSKIVWECEELPLNSPLKQCWSAGTPPTDIYKKGSMFFYSRPEVVKNENLQKFNKGLTAKNIEKNYEILRNELINCYRRSLLGYSNCMFGSYSSFETVANRIDLTSLNQINTLVRTLAPIITNFRADATTEQRQEFLNNLDHALTSVPNKIITLQSAETDPLIAFRTEFKKIDEELAKLVTQIPNVLEINTRKLLNTEVYDGLIYYNEQTKDFFKNN